MRQLSESEYRRISFFRDRSLQNPDPKLDKLRTLTLTYGLIVLTICIVGIAPERVSVGIITGTLKRPDFLLIPLSFLFIYYFYSYDLRFRKELGRFKLERSDKVNFAISIVEYLVEQQIKEKLSDFTLNHNRLSIKKASDEEIDVDINLRGVITEGLLSEVSKTLAIDQSGTMLGLTYTLSDKDIIYFNSHKEFAQTVKKTEVVEYFIPKYFGCIVLIVLTAQNTYFIWKSLHH